MKRIVIPILFLFVCLFNVSCHRDQPKIQDENEEPIQLFSYSVKSDGVTITGLTEEGKAYKEIVVPEAIENSPVIYINYRAFSNCLNMTSIVIPNSVTNMGEEVFLGCSELVTVSIGNNVEEINYSKMFEGCNNLTSITVNIENRLYSSIDGVVYNKDQTELIYCPRGKIGELTIPTSVSAIKADAFSECLKNTTVIFEDDNKLVKLLFSYIISKKSEILITGLTSLGKIQKSLVIPNQIDGFPVIAIEQDVCGENLTSVTIPDSICAVTGLKDKFNNYDIDYWNDDFYSGYIPKWVRDDENIFRYLFENCPALLEINVYSDSTKFSSKDGVLYNKEQTKLIYCPHGKQGELTVSDTVTEIEQFAFFKCGLSLLRIPNAVPQAKALAGMRGDIYFGAGVTYIESNCFEFDNSEISFSERLWAYSRIDCDNGYPHRTTIEAFPRIHINEDNPYYCEFDGGVFNKDKTRLVLYYNNENEEYVIPSTVTEICDFAFAECKNLIKIIIPESVTDIGKCVFYNCTGLTSIIIPSKTKYIGKYMFDGCLNLTDITILGGEIDDFAFSSLDVSGGNKSWFDTRYTVTCKRLNIGENVSRLSPLCFCEGYRRVGGGDGRFFSFPQIIIDDKNPYYCCFDEVVFNRNKTEIIFCSQKKTGEYIVPDTVTTIKEFSFAGSNLNSVILSRDLVNIEKCAFYGFQNYPLQIKIKTIKFFKKYKNKGGGRCCIDELFVDYSGWDYDYIYNVNLLFLDDEIEERKLFSWQIDHGNSTIIISDAMTVIPSDLFSDCSFLQFVIIPNSITYIDSGAFSGCETLETIRIERNEPPIASPDIFEYCSTITSIEVPSSAVEIYKTAEGWSEYAEKIVGY